MAYSEMTTSSRPRFLFLFLPRKMNSTSYLFPPLHSSFVLGKRLPFHESPLTHQIPVDILLPRLDANLLPLSHGTTGTPSISLATTPASLKSMGKPLNLERKSDCKYKIVSATVPLQQDIVGYVLPLF